METAQIKKLTKSHTDKLTGEWIEGELELVAIVESSRQPKSGEQRALERQTEYESQYIAIIEEEDINYTAGNQSFRQGFVYEDEKGQQYDIVFSAHWRGSHYELELEMRE